MQKQQYYLLLTIICLSTVGVAMPYPMMAPLFFHSHFMVSDSKDLIRVLLGITLAAYPFGQFFGSAIIGKLSDQFGRKKILQYSLVGAAFGYILSALAIASHHVYLLILARLFTGVVESNYAVAQAFIVDIADDKHKRLGALAAVGAIGYVVGPLMGGLLSEPKLLSFFNFATPFYVTSLMIVMIIILIHFFLHDPKTKKMKQADKNFLEFNTFKIIKSILQQEELKWLIIAASFVYLAINSYYEFYPVILAINWHMDAFTIAKWTVILSLGIALGARLLPSWLSSKFPTKYSLSFLLALMILFLNFLIIHNKFCVSVQFILIGFSIGALSTMQVVIVSNHSDRNRQGEVLGVLSSLRMLGNAFICIIGGFLIIGSTMLPIIFAGIFAFFGLIFYCRSL